MEANQDVILALQAGFIGPWGEWHSSTHFKCSAANVDRREILTALLAAVPERDVQIRYPRGKLDLFYPDAESDMELISISDNLLLNPDFENGLSTWTILEFEGSITGVVLETEDSKSGNSVKVSPNFSVRQIPALTEEQGQGGNIM